MTHIHQLSAAELAAAFRSKSLSPVEVAKSLFAHIARWEPELNAMYRIRSESALAAASAAEARWRAREPASVLDGVPITLKENLYTRGDPAPLGTAAGDHRPRIKDAPPAARSREAGLVLLGKTTMPDFGMLSSGLSSVHGVTRNPWRLDRNPSGSSAGAAAAAAAGYGPLHVGTDIGGSVRLPATHCGLFGLKPSLGRIPIDPPYMGRVAGPMTRTVLDAALLMNVLTRPDPRDFMSLPYREVDYAAGLESLDLRGLRIGLLETMGVGLPVAPEVLAAVRDAARALEGAGAIVEPLPSFLSAEMLDGMLMFFEARSCRDVLAMDQEQRDRILPFIVEWCTYRARNFSGSEVMGAYGQVVAMREAAVRAVGRFDFVLSPTSPILPYEAGIPCPGSDPHDALPHIAFTVAYNMSEQPAASLNWSFSGDGLPVGVQVIGQRFDDLGVLRLSRALEGLRGPQRTWPEPPPRAGDQGARSL